MSSELLVSPSALSQQQLNRGSSLTSIRSSSSSFNLHSPRTKTTDDSTLISLEVRTLIGKTFSLIAFTTDTIAHLKSQILYEQNCSSGDNNISWTMGNAQETIVIVYKGTTLVDNDASLCDYGIHADTQIDVFPRLRAGQGNPTNELAEMMARTELLDQLIEPGTIVVLCNQENELFVLEVQLRNRQGQPKVLRNLDGTEKSYIDMTLSSWDAEGISNALVNGGQALQDLFKEVQRLEGPLLGLEVLSSADASTIVSRPASAEEVLDNRFARYRSGSLSNSPRGSIVSLSRKSSDFSQSSLAFNLDQLGGQSSNTLSDASIIEMEQTEVAGAELPSLRSTRARPVTRYRQRNRTVADPCILATHEVSLTNVPVDCRPISSRPLPPIQTEQPSLSNHLETIPLLPRPLSPPICKMCSKRLRIGLSGIKCKCGLRFCADHKAEGKHNCTWDWKASGKATLQGQLTACIPQKVSSI